MCLWCFGWARGGAGSAKVVGFVGACHSGSIVLGALAFGGFEFLSFGFGAFAFIGRTNRPGK